MGCGEHSRDNDIDLITVRTEQEQKKQHHPIFDGQAIGGASFWLRMYSMTFTLGATKLNETTVRTFGGNLPSLRNLRRNNHLNSALLRFTAFGHLTQLHRLVATLLTFQSFIELVRNPVVTINRQTSIARHEAFSKTRSTLKAHPDQEATVNSILFSYIFHTSDTLLSLSFTFLSEIYPQLLRHHSKHNYLPR